MDKPDVESIEGIPPTIAIDQSRPVRTSRSTVGTMTELHDHFKLLFAKIGVLALPRLRAYWSSATARNRFTPSLTASTEGTAVVLAFPLAALVRGVGRRAQRFASGGLSPFAV